MHESYAKLVGAATGSTMTALTMTPFDVIKTRLQTQKPVERPLVFPRPPKNLCCQPSGVPCVRNMSSLAHSLTQEELVCVWENGVFRTQPVNGFSDAIRHVWKAEGSRGLWKGVGTTLLIGVPSSTSYMLTYDHLLKVSLPPYLPEPIVPLVAGVIARSAISSLASPLEMIRTNLQSTPLSTDNPHTLRSVISSIRALVRVQGIPVLYRGLSATLWRDIPFSGIYWAGYEALKKSFAKNGHQGAWVAFVSGAVSGSTSALLTSPMDVIKTRRQALVMTGSSSGVTATFPLVKQIIRSEGVSALFAGLTPRIAKIAPACGIMIACFEGVGRLLSSH